MERYQNELENIAELCIVGTLNQKENMKSNLSRGIYLSLALACYCFCIVGKAAVVTTQFVPAGTIGSLYYAQLTATGPPPYTWTLAPGSGALPGGMLLSTNGTLYGTNLAQGTFNITVRVKDGLLATVDKALTVV